MGVSAPGFAAMRALARSSMEAGAAGVMIASPNTLRTDDAIVNHDRQAVEEIGPDVPFAPQDDPLNFSVVMSPGVIRRVVDENPSCVMVEHDAQRRPGGGLDAAARGEGAFPLRRLARVDPRADSPAPGPA